MIFHQKRIFKFLFSKIFILAYSLVALGRAQLSLLTYLYKFVVTVTTYQLNVFVSYRSFNQTTACRYIGFCSTGFNVFLCKKACVTTL